jgi:uncharacterized protein
MGKQIFGTIYFLIFTTLICGAKVYDKTFAPLFLEKAKGDSLYSTPKYAKKRKFKEREIYFKGNDFLIPGTLTIPKRGKKLPLVILIPGYGIYDRDCTIGSTKAFKDLAWGLASKKVAVIRYDKRSFIYAAKITEFFDDQYTAYEDIITDAIAAIKLAKSVPKISHEKIYLAGHDLGGMLSPRIAGMSPGLKGIILLAANARPLEDLILEQMRLTGEFAKDRNLHLKNAGAMNPEKIENQVSEVKNPRLSIETSAYDLPLNLSPRFWLDLRNYNAFAAARNTRLPLLFLQGENDQEITVTDLNIWKEELKDYKTAEFKTYPGLNHFFIDIGSDNSASGSLSGAVVEDISKWVKKKTKKKKSKGAKKSAKNQ